MSSSVARPSPTIRGSRYAEPMSAPERPTRVNRNANDAERARRRKSLASAITEPAPAATPLIAAMTGSGHSRSALTTAPVIRVNSSSSAASMLLQLADDLLDVAARAEAASLAGEHEHAGVAAVGKLGEQVAQVGVDVEGQRVELVGAVEGQRRDAVVDARSRSAARSR